MISSENVADISERKLALLTAPYALRSAVPVEVFREFISALSDAGGITNANADGLALLAAEFGFEALAARLTAFRFSVAFAGDVEARADRGAGGARTRAGPRRCRRRFGGCLRRGAAQRGTGGGEVPVMGLGADALRFGGRGGAAAAGRHVPGRCGGAW
jgi:hypothetical protein